MYLVPDWLSPGDPPPPLRGTSSPHFQAPPVGSPDAVWERAVPRAPAPDIVDAERRGVADANLDAKRAGTHPEQAVASVSPAAVRSAVYQNPGRVWQHSAEQTVWGGRIPLEMESRVPELSPDPLLQRDIEHGMLRLADLTRQLQEKK
eukprot:Sspe_Gene.86767::Locus_57537_Transcript_1_1_Confidence_1.000_Length_548::g.86767::m.86767